MFQRFGCIYKITNLINGKVYIGQTTRKLKYRWNEHCKRSSNIKLYRSIRKYGSENFNIEEIYNSFNIEDLNNKEEFFIIEYDSINTGYNLNSGGKNYIQTEETIQKKIKALTGRTVSIETRNKISLSETGKKKPTLWKKIQCLTNNTIYSSIKEASFILKLDPSAVTKVLKNKIQFTKGYKFIYVD